MEVKPEDLGHIEWQAKQNGTLSRYNSDDFLHVEWICNLIIVIAELAPARRFEAIGKLNTLLSLHVNSCFSERGAS